MLREVLEKTITNKNEQNEVIFQTFFKEFQYTRW